MSPMLSRRTFLMTSAAWGLGLAAARGPQVAGAPALSLLRRDEVLLLEGPLRTPVRLPAGVVSRDRQRCATQAVPSTRRVAGAGCRYGRLV